MKLVSWNGNGIRDCMKKRFMLSDILKKKILDANILTEVYGSEHSPVEVTMDKL